MNAELNDPTDNPQDQRQHLAALTSVRFIAAFLVLMSHGLSVFPFLPKLTVYSYAVPFFFVLSGFILMHTYGSGDLNIGRFFRARLARLWPAHVTWLFIGFFVVGYTIDWPKLILNVMMLHAWSPYRVDFYSYNSVSWSISTEMALYAAFPFLAKGFRQNWPFKLALCIVLYQAVYLYALNYPPSKDYRVIQFGSWLYAFPPSRLHGFCLGMVAFVLWEKWRARYDTLPPLAGEVVGLLVLAGALQFTKISWVYSDFRWLIPVIVYTAFAALLIPIAQGRGPLSRLLAWRPLVYLGEISFALYLSHQIILNYFVRSERADPNFWWAQLSDPVKFAIYVAVVIAASAATYHWVERPAQKLLKTGRIPRYRFAPSARS